MSERTFQHGTAQGYNYHRCRCDECVAWRRAYAVEHRAENAAYQRAYGERNVGNQKRRQQLRGSHLRRKYQLTLAAFDAMLLSQDHRCANAACGATEPGGFGTWCVDHDHSCCEMTPTCGRCTRGLLCWNCNIAAGHLRDDPVIAQGLVDYLKRGVLPLE